LIPTLSARENMLLPLTLAGRDPDRVWFDEVVATVGMSDQLDRLPSQLSGGQQQRVAVARALIPRPELIFADEPTGALDTRTGIEILTFMRKAVDDGGQTIVMVTHDPHAASYADHVLFLADGQIVDEIPEPTADRVLDRMKRFEG
jgi:putative ABC transport system ATP-binding protein